MKYLLPILFLCGCEAKVEITSTPIARTNVAAEVVEAFEPKPQTAPKHTNMPPGFVMVCDIERGVYSAMWGEGRYVWALNPHHSNKQEVIDRAWITYEIEQRGETAARNRKFQDFDWSTCE